MADLSINLAGIRSPNPFWLASAPQRIPGTRYSVRLKQAGVARCGRHLGADY